MFTKKIIVLPTSMSVTQVGAHMSFYEYLNIPKSCEVGSTIFKKLFYEKADLSATDKSLFVDSINKITWVYCLKTDNTNISPYKDANRDYTEVEIIEVELIKQDKLNRIAEIIMRAIPYPMLLIFKLHDKTQLYAAHQRINQNDKNKNTLEKFICTEWLDNDSPLFKKLDIKEMRLTNFFVLYSDIVDAISIYNASIIFHTNVDLTGEEARQATSKIEAIELEISSLRTKLKKETQFNRRMELNIQIKKLEKDREKTIGEYVE